MINRNGVIDLDFSCICERAGRSNNEDCLSIAQKDGAYCFTVCDGLGGHGKGEVASATVCNSFKELFEEHNTDLSTFLESAFSAACSRIRRAAQENSELACMKTTAVSLIIDKKRCSWGHVGDSRLYGFKDGKVIRITEDHSVPYLLVKSGSIKFGDIRRHPDRNKLLRAIGPEDSEETDFEVVKEERSEDFDAFLLCTDGFWEYINERKMCRLLRHSSNPSQWLAKMKKAVCAKGRRCKMDNYTAVAIITNAKECSTK